MFGKAHFTRRLATSLGIVASALALAAPSALAYDPRSPDTQEAAAAAVTAVDDARSPDTRATAVPAQASISSDARDAASRALSSTPTDATAPSPAGGFDWSDFGIGLGAGFGVVLMLGLIALVVLAARQRRGADSRPATA